MMIDYGSTSGSQRSPGRNHSVVASCGGAQRLVSVLPTDQRWETDEKTGDPHEADKYFGTSRRHDAGVGDGPGDCDVTVQRDGAQVQY